MRISILTLTVFSLVAGIAITALADEHVVYSTADDGLGSLRQCMGSAANGDTITFDPATFPPSAPGTVVVLSAFPDLVSGNVTMDASSAGVVLNGSAASPGAAGFIVDSDSNSIRGVEIINFPGGGIVVAAGADSNTVEGNLISGTGGHGLQIHGENNVVESNLIGTDVTGTAPMGNAGSGIYILGVADNYIGPGNTISYNGHSGIAIAGALASGNTVTQNSFTGNTLAGITLSGGGNGGIAAPVITECTETSIEGTAPPSCIIEVFSDAGDEGRVYEGMTTSDGTGAFVFNEPGGWADEYITATARDATGNTSEFSPAASVGTEPTTWGRVKAEWRR